MKIIFVGLLQFVLIGAHASTTEKCAVFCDHEESGHDINTQGRDYFDGRSLPTTPPKIETTLNCFKPILACIGKLDDCSSKKLEVLWKPNKESQLPSKTIAAVCKESKNLGRYLKAALGEGLLSQSTGTFTIKSKTQETYYYKAVAGE